MSAVFHSHGDGPNVSSYADENRAMAVALHHQSYGKSMVKVTNYLTKEAARELARNLLAACDAIDVHEARQRNLSLALAPPTTESTP